MEILAILVAAAILSAAVVWWGMTRPDSPRRATPRLIGFGHQVPEADGSFVFGPASGAPREGRPPAAVSIVRLVVVIGVSTVLLVAVAWAIGFLVKVQLDRYLLRGG